MSQDLPFTGNGHSASVAKECRVYERQDCSLPTTCQPAVASDSHEVRWSATIQNISQGGVCLSLTRRFEKGTSLAVELPGDGERDSYVVFVKVVHLRRGSGRGWVLGCKFLSILSEEEIERLVSTKHHVLTSQKNLHKDETL